MTRRHLEGTPSTIDAAVVKPYASAKWPLARVLSSTTPGKYLSHWIFQGLLIMDPTERSFKIGLDIGFAAAIYPVLARFPLSRSSRAALALLGAHTINFLANAHVRALPRWHGHKTSTDKLRSDLHGISERLSAHRSIQDTYVYGSLSRGELSATSDLDLRVLRKPGLANGFAACAAVTAERCRAMVGGVPLDIFVWDSLDRAIEMRDDEPVVLLIDWCERDSGPD